MTKRLNYKGIFCLEGDWESMKCRISVEPMLELLHRKYNSNIKYICRDVVTRPEFNHYLSKWKQNTFRDYPILYLCFHGSEEIIHVGDQRKREGFVSLNDIEEQLASSDLRKRVIYFGSCSTLNISANRIKQFINNTGIVGVLGYASDIEWVDSTALDLIMLDWLQYYTITANGLSAIERRVKRDLSGLITKLKLRIITR